MDFVKPVSIPQKKIIENAERINMLIEDHGNFEVRQGLQQLMGHVGEEFFTAPASSHAKYHNCCVGGLADHSLRVYDNLMKLAAAFSSDFKTKITDDSLTLVALFHDVGKVGNLDGDKYFIRNESDWHRQRGILYTHNEDLEYLGTAQRSLRLLTECGVPLTEDEYKAILIHDGQYIPENKPYAHKEGVIGLLLHQADMLACKMEHYAWKAIQ